MSDETTTTTEEQTGRALGTITVDTTALHPASDREVEAFARDLYATYNASTGGKNYQGLPCPNWQDLGVKVQRAWRATARRAIELGASAGPLELSDWVLGESRLDEKLSTWERYRLGPGGQD